MDTVKYFRGETETELWQQVSADLNRDEDILNYTAVLETQNKKVALDIDIDLGGGFESGYALTTFHSVVDVSKDFKFALHHEGFTDEIGKFFGMEDKETGYEQFDKSVVVKTNDIEKVKEIFADVATRETIQSLNSFNFHISTHHVEDTDVKETFLELEVDEGITNVARLQELFRAFLNTLLVLEKHSTVVY